MFCKKCGAENSSDAKFCIGCGAALEAVEASIYAPPRANSSSNGMTIDKAIEACMSKFANFEGRASRPEYWWFYLFTILLGWAAHVVDRSGTLSGLVNIVMLIPVFSAGSRRLHDTNRSGWRQLLILTVIGVIPLIFWMASKGDEQENRYGKLE